MTSAPASAAARATASPTTPAPTTKTCIEFHPRTTAVLEHFPEKWNSAFRSANRQSKDAKIDFGHVPIQIDAILNMHSCESEHGQAKLQRQISDQLATKQRSRTFASGEI
jgi:hypothetical protein